MIRFSVGIIIQKQNRFGMEANYVREAAGPLDQRLIYNEKIGIESRGKLNSYFNVVEQKRKSGDRVRYIPANNLSYILDRSKNIFVDKYNNIIDLIKIFLPLKTEQSEIVATLYACWNDLLIIKKTTVSDDDIINDFLNNWHVSKKRFTDIQLRKALSWMREKKIVPSGLGIITSTKQEKIPSGF